MLHGFFLGIGFFLSLAFLILIPIIIKKMVPTRASVELWQQYLDECIKNQDYKEAKYIKELLEKQEESKYDEMKLPKGYRVEKKTKIIEDDEKALGIEIQVIKTIKKIKNH